MEAGCSTCIKGQVLRSSGNHDGRLYIKRIVSFAATDKQEPIASPTSDTPVLQETEGSTGDPPTSGSSSYFTERGVGKPGFISFQGNSSQTRSVESVPHPGKEAFRVVWFVGPTILVAFLVLPSLTCAKYSELFEDSLLTVTTMVLSLIILFLTMGMVWPWTGPGASATLAPYLIGLVVQFSFEQYARHRKSPSWPVIPIIFKDFRTQHSTWNRGPSFLIVANRQSNSLIGGTTFTLISYALSPMTDVGLFQRALLTVLQILGIICVWSLLSFLVRFLPSSDIPDP